MSEAFKKRRRWRWVMAATILLLLVAVFGWRYRPLNSTERTLIGVWQEPEGLGEFRFESNRRFVSSSNRNKEPDMTGGWSASPGMLALGSDVSLRNLTGLAWGTAVKVYFKAKSPDPVEIRMDGPDRFWLDGHEFVRVPSPDAPGGASQSRAEHAGNSSKVSKLLAVSAGLRVGQTPEAVQKYLSDQGISVMRLDRSATRVTWIFGYDSLADPILWVNFDKGADLSLLLESWRVEE